MIKILLNFIFNKVREGEIFIVLGVNDSCKSTLSNAFTNYIVQENLKGPINLNDEKLEGWPLKVISTLCHAGQPPASRAHRGRDVDVIHRVLAIRFGETQSA
ncbi:hypothetical protein GW17_00057329 [Ensete ventricosum]|nr:hypothetical protein GW17_00057329 [Ensete ventricosum]